MKEKLLKVQLNKEADVRPRIQLPEETLEIVTSKDGELCSLWEDKEKYPYKLYNDIEITITTNLRTFSFGISKDYTYDGASIIRPLHSIIGSKGEPKFLVPALIHDYMLEYMKFIYKVILKGKMTMQEYRRLSTDIFKYELKYYGTKPVKSNFMGGCVYFWQCTGASKQWRELKNENKTDN